jgi:hypothetical protein
MVKWKSRCPYFSNCVTPCVHGMSSYYFVTHVCLTAEHKTCITYAGHNPPNVLGPASPDVVSPMFAFSVTKKGRAKAKREVDWRFKPFHPEVHVLDDLQECPRLAWCLKKNEHPVEEYQEIVCRTRTEHGNCLFYFVWYQNGSDPDNRMEDVVIHREYFEHLEDTVAAVTGGRPYFRAGYPVVDARGFTAEEINNGKLHGNVHQS